jgi:hypothetical protein
MGVNKRRMLFLSALVFAGALTLQPASAQVRINEFLANNVACNPDMCDYGDFSDWIELYNDGSAAADLSGYYFADDANKPKEAAIPSGTSVPSKGYLLFWADGHNAKPGQSGKRPDESGTAFTTKRYHTSIKIKKTGEKVILLDGSGKIVDSVSFGPQFADISMGRKADGSWAYFDQPTPGASNSTPAKGTPISGAVSFSVGASNATSAKGTQFSGTVSFSVPGGYYSSAQSITLTAPDGSDIYYTTDGTTPYASGATSKKYSAAISASAAAVIRARCIAADKLAGPVVTNTYFVSEKKRGVMVVNLTTDPAFLDDATIGIFKNYYKFAAAPVYMEFFTPDGKLAAKANARIQVGSLTNYGSAQKPLQVELFANNGDEYINYKFFNKPITQFNKLRLRQGGDAWNTNFIADDLLDPISNGQMAYGYQAYCPVVQYINGKYYGLMDLREQFHGNFFKENYGVDTTGMQEVRRLLINNAEGWQTVHGSKSSWDQVVNSSATASNYETVKSKVDIDGLIDFVVMETYACNISWGHNEDMWMVPGGKWKWLTTDIDRCFDYKGTYSSVSTDILHTKGGGLSPSFITGNEIFANLMKVTEFKNHFGQRYMAHLNSTLDSDRLKGIIDSIVGMLTPEMTDETSKWGSQGGIKSVSAWKTAIQAIQDFCTERGDLVRGHLAKDITTGNAKLTVTVTNPKSGDIYIEGVRMCGGLSGLTFFKGAPLTLTAVPKKGCTFKSWGGGASGSAVDAKITLSGDQTVTAAFDGTPSGNLQAPRENTNLRCIDRVSSHSGAIALSVDFSFEKSDHATINLFNLSGEKLLNLFDSNMNPGIQHIALTSKKLSAGVYFYSIKTNAYTRTNAVTVR